MSLGRAAGANEHRRIRAGLGCLRAGSDIIRIAAHDSGTVRGKVNSLLDFRVRAFTILRFCCCKGRFRRGTKAVAIRWGYGVVASSYAQRESGNRAARASEPPFPRQGVREENPPQNSPQYSPLDSMHRLIKNRNPQQNPPPFSLR